MNCLDCCQDLEQYGKEVDSMQQFNYDISEIKKKLQNEKIHYNGMNLLSNTDCDILQSIGARGCGKTTWWVSWFICDFIENGKQFTHLVRYKDDLKEKDIFFLDVQGLLFNDFEFKIEGNKGFIRLKKKKQKKDEGWKWMCLFISISKAKTMKITNYPNMHNILFDEFQLDTTDKRLNRYINGEIKYFGSIIQSLKRTRPGVVIMLSNALSITNPYFTKWNICPIDKKIVKKKIKSVVRGKVREGRIACESVDASAYLDIAVESQAAKISMMCGLSDSDIENQYINDNDNFLRKDKPKNAKFIFTIKINGKYIGLWHCYDHETSMMFIYACKQYNGQSRRYCFKKADMDEISILAKSTREYNDLASMKKYVNANRCYFQNQFIKGEMFEVFSILNIY